MRKLPDVSSLTDFLFNSSGNYYLVVHDQADPDAIGSAIALHSFILTLNPSASVYLLQVKISRLGLFLLDKLDFKFNFVSKKSIVSGSTIIFLDTTVSPEYTAFIGSENKVLVIDHHIPFDSSATIHLDFRLPDFYSTTEIVSSIFYFTNITPKPYVKIALLVGLLFDTRRFFFADEETFECLNYLIKDDPSIYQRSLSYLSNSRSVSEKVACIKAAQRMKLVKINDFLLLFSNVGAFEASAARALIGLGGDLVFVISQNKTETRISCRSTSEFHSATSISLGKDVIPALITRYGGTGGGHDGAAGYNISLPLSVSELKNFLIEFIRSRISPTT